MSERSIRGGDHNTRYAVEHLRTHPGDCRMYETYEGARVGSVVGFRVFRPGDLHPFRAHSRTIRGGGWSTRYAADHLKAIPRDCGTPGTTLAVGVRVFRPVLTPTGDQHP